MADATRRIYRFMSVLAAVGAVVAYAGWGLAAAVGFLAGTAVAFLNFRWMVGMTMALGTEAKPVSAIWLAGRYLIFAAIGYVIFRFSETGFLAALAGCCVNIAAVLLEVIYELIYAGTS